MNVLHAVPAAPRGLSGSVGPRKGFGALVWTAVAAVVALSSVAFGNGLPTSYIYGIDDSSQLWVMALSGTTGSSTFLGTSVLTASSANGLAYDNSREQLFGVDTTTSELYWWQQGATNYTSLGNISAYTTGIGQLASAAYYNDAYWFLGSGNPGNVLGKLDVTYTGGIPTAVSGTSFTIVGMSGTSASGGGDMVITPAGTLFAYSAPGFGNFFSVDVTTAASGTVGGYNLISNTPNFGLQLALGIDNTTLYGSDTETGNWFVVDTSTGNTTPVDLQTKPAGGRGFRDLGGSSIQAVPEPSTMVLAAMGLGIVAWQVTRRRRKVRGPGDADVTDGPSVALLT